MRPRLRTQADPSPAATLKGCGTGIWIPTEGSPLDVVAGGWPVQPTVAAARSTTTVSRRQPGSQLLLGSRCPGSTRRRRTSAGYHGGGSIAAPHCEDGWLPGYTARARQVPPSSRPAEPTVNHARYCHVRTTPAPGFKQLRQPDELVKR